MSNDINAKTIVKVVKNLIGEIEPVGAEHIDGERLINLEKHLELLNVLYDDIFFLIDKRDDYRSSVKKIGDKSYKNLKGMYESLHDVIDE